MSASASVSTWQIGTMVEAQATGSIRINGVAIEGDYINFLMAGGGAGANVGVSLYVAGTGMTLTTYAPNFCTDKYLKGGQHWAHFDVRALDGLVVDIEIRDQDATSDCGFIAFDHFYQSDSSQGTAVRSRTVCPAVRGRENKAIPFTGWCGTLEVSNLQ